MSVTQYIGARYVPLFADPAEWNNTRAYEPLTIVLYQGNSYTSRQAVPIGIEIDNTDYWVLTGNYNAQVEAYRQEVQQFNGRISALEASQEEIDEAIEELQKQFSIRKQIEASQIGTISFGQIVYDPCNGMADHPGAICTIGTNQYIISSPLYEEYYGTGAGHFRTISIENNYDNPETKVTANYGHANSMCYSKEIGSLVYAPLWRRASATPPEQSLREWCAYVETLTNNGAIGRRIELNKAGAQAAAVSYDEIGEKRFLTLAIELMGKHSNIILYDKKDSVIIGCAHNVGAEKSRYRELQGGLKYIYPPVTEVKLSNELQSQFKNLSEKSLGRYYVKRLLSQD